jgi:hypothetical protein
MAAPRRRLLNSVPRGAMLLCSINQRIAMDISRHQDFLLR